MAVGGGAVDIVDADRDLGDDLEPAAAPAAKTSSSTVSRSVVISAAMPERTFSSTRAFGGGCGSG